MALRISLTREDVLAGKVVKPGWYNVQIKDVEPKPSKTDQSTNYWFTFIIQDEGPFKGVPIRKNFSEKWLAPMGGLISAVTGKQFDGGEVDLEAMAGKTILIKTINKEYNGSMQNDIEAYKPV